MAEGAVTILPKRQSIKGKEAQTNNMWEYVLYVKYLSMEMSECKQ